MGKEKKTKRKVAPARTPEAMEMQNINLAVNLAAEKLRDGTASPAIITHYLKLGSSISELEKEKLKSDVELLKAKAQNIKKQEDMDEVYKKAIKAMKSYSGDAYDDDVFED